MALELDMCESVSFDPNQPVLIDNRKWREKCKETQTIEDLLLVEKEHLPKERGLVRDPEIVRWTDCPICCSDIGKPWFVKHGFLHVTCGQCGHVYVQNPLRDDRAHRLYQSSTADDANVTLQENSEYQRYWNLVYKKYWAIVNICAGDNPNVLDIGCGVGNFLHFVKDGDEYRKFNLFGVELNHLAGERARAVVGEDRFFSEKVEDIDFKTQFGRIFFWGVLEHLSNPLAVLGKAKALLAPNGIICFLIPNVRSLAVNLLGVHTPTFEPRSHVQFFTDTSIDCACRKLDLEVEGSFYELPVIDLIYPYVDYSEAFAREVTDSGRGYYRVTMLRHGKNNV